MEAAWASTSTWLWPRRVFFDVESTMRNPFKPSALYNRETSTLFPGRETLSGAKGQQKHMQTQPKRLYVVPRL